MGLHGDGSVLSAQTGEEEEAMDAQLLSGNISPLQHTTLLPTDLPPAPQERRGGERGRKREKGRERVEGRESGRGRIR